jgi:hypothetical protein
MNASYRQKYLNGVPVNTIVKIFELDKLSLMVSEGKNFGSFGFCRNWFTHELVLAALEVLSE